MKITDLSVKRPVTATVFYLALIVKESDELALFIGEMHIQGRVRFVKLLLHSG